MEIDKGFDIKLGRGRPTIYPFQKLGVKDSFFIPNISVNKISGCVRYWNKKIAPKEFRASIYDADNQRIEKDGILGTRVMRIK